MKEETENLKTYQFIEDYSLFIKQCYCIIVWSAEKNTESKNSDKSCTDIKWKNNVYIKLCCTW